MQAPPCRSSRATARKRPAPSTTRNCGRWRSGCAYLRELEERRAAILGSIREQGKLDDALRQAIEAADSKARLEDIYLPYKPKRRTKAQIAREAGSEPLADLLLAHPERDPRQAAAAFVSRSTRWSTSMRRSTAPGQSLTERFAEDAELIGSLRDEVWSRGRLLSRVRDGKATDGQVRRLFRLRRKAHEAALASDPGAVPGREGGGARPAVAAGRPAGDVNIAAGVFRATDRAPLRHRRSRPAGRPLAHRYSTLGLADEDLVHIQLDLRMRLWHRRGGGGQGVRRQPADLLLAAPAGRGRRWDSIPVFAPASRWRSSAAPARSPPLRRSTRTSRGAGEAIAVLAKLAREHKVELIAIGNGTASRETDRLAADLMQQHAELSLTKVVVSEAGASVYSTCACAAQELPDLDVSLRGAVSIARRLQDPLAELVKIDPKSIGVGQYQHDLDELKLSRSLDAAVEDCVNAVGVDANTASAPLLARVSGIGDGLAQNIVQHREMHGGFRRGRR